MSVWEKISVALDGEACEAVAPVVISASRATDIPAFHADWLMRGLARGWVPWTNPFNGKTAPVSFARARLFVFWSKNPRPLLAHLPALDRSGLNTLFHFTLNDYEAEGLEPGVPPLEERLATFLELSDRLGPERVVWRFDPLILTDGLGVDGLLRKLALVGGRLHRHTRRLVISFADIAGYANVTRSLNRAGIRAREFAPDDMRRLARGLAALNRDWRLEIATCAETVDLSEFGIGHSRCIDAALPARLFNRDAALMAFLNRLGGAKDKGQRKACGCMPSKDIGAYGACPHACAYCYANRPSARIPRPSL
ncbi:MAG: DUF1848 domain-containing protein [Verrucomicrobiota bacterium]|nr:DUF1848 domain-containing protein [Verrucomicrobiota bacterium]